MYAHGMNQQIMASMAQQQGGMSGGAVAAAAVEDVRCGATGVGAGRDDADELIAAVEGAVVVVVLVAGASSA